MLSCNASRLLGCACEGCCDDRLPGAQPLGGPHGAAAHKAASGGGRPPANKPSGGDARAGWVATRVLLVVLVYGVSVPAGVRTGLPHVLGALAAAWLASLGMAAVSVCRARVDEGEAQGAKAHPSSRNDGGAGGDFGAEDGRERERLRMSTMLRESAFPFSEAVARSGAPVALAWLVALATLLVAHLVQPAAFLFSLVTWWPSLSLAAKALGSLVAVREGTYALATLLCALVRPAFLLTDLRSHWATREWGRLAYFALSPSVFVWWVLSKGLAYDVSLLAPETALAMGSAGMLFLTLLDAAALAALVVALAASVAPAPLVTSYALSSGALAFSLLLALLYMALLRAGATTAGVQGSSGGHQRGAPAGGVPAGVDPGARGMPAGDDGVLTTPPRLRSNRESPSAASSLLFT